MQMIIQLTSGVAVVVTDATTESVDNGSDGGDGEGSCQTGHDGSSGGGSTSYRMYWHTLQNIITNVHAQPWHLILILMTFLIWSLDWKGLWYTLGDFVIICAYINSSAYIYGWLTSTTAAVDRELDPKDETYLKIVPCKLKCKLLHCW